MDKIELGAIATKWIEDTNGGNYLYLGNILVAGYKKENVRFEEGSAFCYRTTSYWANGRHLDFSATESIAKTFCLEDLGLFVKELIGGTSGID